MTEPTAGGPSGAYGPNTPRVRRFLVRLAALGQQERDAVVARFTEVAATRAFAAAELALADAIQRSGRQEASDALAGPLLQIVRRAASPVQAESASGTDAAQNADPLVDLDPVAEAALSALLALVAEDLVSGEHRRHLYRAFADAIPLDRLDG